MDSSAAILFPEPWPLLGGMIRVRATIFQSHPRVEQMLLCELGLDVPRAVPEAVKQLVINTSDTNIGPLVAHAGDLATAAGLAEKPGWAVVVYPEDGGMFVLLHFASAQATLLLSDEVVVPTDIDKGSAGAGVEHEADEPSPQEWDLLLDDLAAWGGAA